MTDETSEALKRERKYLDAIYWGGVILWAGLVFGAENLGFLPEVGQAGAWDWVFLGAGVYGFLGSLVRLASARFSNPTTWDYVWSGIFTIIGASGFTAFDIGFQLVLILVGAVILIGAITRRR